MLKNLMNKNVIIVAVLSTVLVIFSSCHKNVVDQPASNLGPVTENDPSEEYKMKDSVMQLTRDIYLWYNQIPATFDPQTYATPYLPSGVAAHCLL
jgi:hypothetical protein